MKDFKIYLIIGSLLIAGYIIAEYNKPTPTNWQTTLRHDHKIPYGTYVFYHQLQHLFPAAKVSRINVSPAQVFQDTTRQPGNYFMIATSISMSETDWKAMLSYIRRGNHVFMSAFNWRDKLVDTLQLETGIGYNKPVTLNFTSPQLKTPAGYHFKAEVGGLYFSNFDTAHAVSVSRNQNGQTNLLRFAYGEGSLTLLANPHLLTNYSLLNTPQGAAYVAGALAYLPQTSHIYWDQYQNNDIPTDESPLRVIFAHASLRWAYYISLGAMLLFILFEVKRRQRIIPVITPLQNATADFVNVVGQVYYEQRDHRDIALKKITYFSDYLRSRYQLKVAFNERDAIKQIAHKTGADAALVKELLQHISYIYVQSRIDEQELIILNTLIDKFHTQA